MGLSKPAMHQIVIVMGLVVPVAYQIAIWHAHSPTPFRRASWEETDLEIGSGVTITPRKTMYPQPKVDDYDYDFVKIQNRNRNRNRKPAI